MKAEDYQNLSNQNKCPLALNVIIIIALWGKHFIHTVQAWTWCEAQKRRVNKRLSNVIYVYKINK